MYRRSKFIEVLHQIRQEMADEADHDPLLMIEMARSGELSHGTEHTMLTRPDQPETNKELEIEKAAK